MAAYRILKLGLRASCLPCKQVTMTTGSNHMRYDKQCLILILAHLPMLDGLCTMPCLLRFQCDWS